MKRFKYSPESTGWRSNKYRDGIYEKIGIHAGKNGFSKKDYIEHAVAAFLQDPQGIFVKYPLHQAPNEMFHHGHGWSSTDFQSKALSIITEIVRGAIPEEQRAGTFTGDMLMNNIMALYMTTDGFKAAKPNPDLLSDCETIKLYSMALDTMAEKMRKLHAEAEEKREEIRRNNERVAASRIAPTKQIRSLNDLLDDFDRSPPGIGSRG